MGPPDYFFQELANRQVDLLAEVTVIPTDAGRHAGILASTGDGIAMSFAGDPIRVSPKPTEPADWPVGRAATDSMTDTELSAGLRFLVTGPEGSGLGT